MPLTLDALPIFGGRLLGLLRGLGEVEGGQLPGEEEEGQGRHEVEHAAHDEARPPPTCQHQAVMRAQGEIYAAEVDPLVSDPCSLVNCLISISCLLSTLTR